MTRNTRGQSTDATWHVHTQQTKCESLRELIRAAHASARVSKFYPVVAHRTLRLRRTIHKSGTMFPFSICKQDEHYLVNDHARNHETLNMGVYHTATDAISAVEELIPNEEIGARCCILAGRNLDVEPDFRGNIFNGHHRFTSEEVDSLLSRNLYALISRHQHSKSQHFVSWSLSSTERSIHMMLPPSGRLYVFCKPIHCKNASRGPSSSSPSNNPMALRCRRIRSIC